MTTANIDEATVSGFGLEWSRYDQTALPDEEAEHYFHSYFRIFPWEVIGPNSVGFDLGCGSGRWARFVAPRVGSLHCIDASTEALGVAKRNLATASNCTFHCASVDRLNLPDGSMDFGYSLGVLHHVPDTAAGLRSCVEKLKIGAPFLLYLYYRFDNRPAWYRMLWRASDVLRQRICRLPPKQRLLVTSILAGTVYWPLARTARLLEHLGVDAQLAPLYVYRNASLYSMRTDALDRFGTALEQRFSRPEIHEMMERAGLERISFSDELPYWCAVGYRSR